MAKTSTARRAPEMGTEEHLLDCALSLFAAKGYEATSVRQIIDAAGVTQPTLYYYCRNKADLFHRLVRKFYEAAQDELARTIHETSGCEARLRLMVRRSFDYCARDPRIPQLMFQTHYGPLVPEVAKAIKKLTSQRFALVTRVMQDGLDANEVIGSNAKSLALIFCCLMDQPINVLSRLPHPERHLTTEFADLLVSTFLRGVGTTPGRRSARTTSR
jgi:AcrR family transcriptional regulator